MNCMLEYYKYKPTNEVEVERIPLTGSRSKESAHMGGKLPRKQWEFNPSLAASRSAI